MYKHIITLLAVYCLYLKFPVHAQSSILNRTVTVSINNQRLDRALDQIAGAGQFSFSYNSGIIKTDSLVTVYATGETVKSVLDKLFKSRIRYVESGNYLILKKNSSTYATNKPQKTTYIISGYVINTLTGEKINDASVYDITTLASALSGPEGAFTLKIPSTIAPGSIMASKADFLDTVIIVKPDEFKQVAVPLTPVVHPVIENKSFTDTTNNHTTLHIAVTDTNKRVEQSGFLKWFLSFKQKMMAHNLNFTNHRKFQLSLLPGISTNRQLGSHIVNDLSLNILGGFTGGTDKLEIGAGFNIDRGSVKYTQVAGLFNIVGDTMKGFQAAGFMNYTMKTVTGMQAAGFVNFTRNQFSGFQAAGFINSVIDSVKGVQTAGCINLATKDVAGTQIAGFMNYARKVKGAQVAGFINVSPVSVTGAQISGFMNYSKNSHGTQIGFINIADSSDACPIGVFSFVVHGFHKLEISANEVTYLNLAFKTGNKKFYNTLMAGINPDINNRYYSIGYGIGHEFTTSKKTGIDLELSCQYLAEYWDTYNGLYKINLNFAYQPSPNFGIVLGPSLNVLYMDDPNAGLFTSHAIPALDMPLLNITERNDFREWVGVHVGVRFM